MPLIQVEDLRFTYRGVSEETLHGLSFSVEEGEVLGFLGPNGSGKSTTQKILIGLLAGYEGQVDLLGKPLGSVGPEVYESIGVAFETPNHFLKLTARENLRYFERLYASASDRVSFVLEAVDLADSADLLVSQYSKGMKTRLSVARALLHDPPVLFLDEPTSGLDPVSARRIKGLIGEQRAAGKTVFLTTHDMVAADQLCDRVAFLVDGSIVTVASPRDLKLGYGERRIRVGYSEAGRLEEQEFPIDGLGEDERFQELLSHPGLETVHTLEASLEEVFLQLTGVEL